MRSSVVTSNWTHLKQVEETDASGEVVNAGLQAEATALGDSVAEVRLKLLMIHLRVYQAEQIESMSSWNQLADVRGNVFAARMQYSAFLRKAKAHGLIRPGAQGMQDIQNLNRKFAEATGLMQAAMTDPKFVADNFSQTANGVARISCPRLHLKVRLRSRLPVKPKLITTSLPTLLD